MGKYFDNISYFTKPKHALDLRNQIVQYECPACGAKAQKLCKIYAGKDLPEGCALHTARIMRWLVDQEYI